jgi:hypothetical protein
MSGEINQVTLTPTEIARLHVEDGFGTDTDMQMLVDAGVDVAGDLALREALNSGLIPAEIPSVADDVMRNIGAIGMPVGTAMAQELGEAPGLSADVMSMLGTDDVVTSDVAKAIEEEGGYPDSLWNGIADVIGVDPGLDLGDLLRAAVDDEAGVSNIEWMPKSRSYLKVSASVGLVFAMAAAVLLWVQTSVPDANVIAQKAMDEMPIFQGPVEIESLEVGAANIAQVLQFDENSPTIIFVGEFEE